MKRPHYDDEVQHLRERLRLRIDAAAKSVAEVLHAAADLFIDSKPLECRRWYKHRQGRSHPRYRDADAAAGCRLSGHTPQTLAVWRCTRRYAVPFVKVGSKVR